MDNECSMCNDWCGQCGQVLTARACGPTHAVMKQRARDFPEHPHGPPLYGPDV